MPDADLNLPEMKTKSPSCPSGGVHMQYLPISAQPVTTTMAKCLVALTSNQLMPQGCIHLGAKPTNIF